jgi:hypothetical protein
VPLKKRFVDQIMVLFGAETKPTKPEGHQPTSSSDDQQGALQASNACSNSNRRNGATAAGRR